MRISKKTVIEVICITLQILFISLYFGRFNINIGFSLKPYMIITFCGFVILHKYMKFSKLFLFEKIMVLFILISSMSALSFRYPISHLRFIFVYFTILIFYFATRGLIVHLSLDKIEKIFSKAGYVAVWFSVFYFIIGMVALEFNFHGNQVGVYGLFLDRNIPRLTGTVHDPNIFVFFITPYFFYVATHLNNKKNIIGFIVASLCIVLTFSRGGYLGVFAGCLLLLVLSKKRLKQFRFGIITLFSLFILYSFKTYLPIDPFELISSRFLDIRTDGGSGRSILWSNAFNTFLDNPLLGIGINATLDYSADFYTRRGYVHNTFLEVLSEMGLIGFMVYMLLWFSLLRYSLKMFKSNNNLFIICTFISMFFQMLFLSILYNEIFYFMILILYSYYKEDFKIRMASQKT